jgi:hypothetical protein
MWFGGLSFCMPVTLALIFGIICTVIYLKRMWYVSMDETQKELNPSLYESWTIGQSVTLDGLDNAFLPPFDDEDDPIVRTL